MSIIRTMVEDAVESLGELASAHSDMILIGNGKTGKSLESKGGCPLMKKVGKAFTSPKCPSCYATNILNNYPGVRKAIETRNDTFADIVRMASGLHEGPPRLSGSPIMPGDRLRCYGITDFGMRNMAALRILGRIYKLDIISKTLHLSELNHGFLVELARMPGMNISLSFNKELPKFEERMAKIVKLVRDNGIGHSVGLNYTFTTDYWKTKRSNMEPLRALPGVGVYHIASKDKHRITQALGNSDGVCGVFEENGKPIKSFRDGSGKKGSCIGCNFCRDNVLDKILPPAPMLAAGE